MVNWSLFKTSFLSFSSSFIFIQLEHENRELKARLKTYRGSFTDGHLDRVSKARSELSKVVRKLDGELGYRTANNTNRELSQQDIQLLFQCYESVDMLSEAQSQGIRTHSPSLLNLSSNCLSSMSGLSLRDWFKERFVKAEIRPYYKQFSGWQAPLDWTSFLDSIPETDESMSWAIWQNQGKVCFVIELIFLHVKILGSSSYMFH